MSDVETDLVKGLAQLLAAAGVASYKPTGGYLATDTAIVFGELPTSPDRCIGITVYSADDEPAIPLSQLRVQFMYRGKPNDSLDAGELAGAVFTLLQGLEHVQLGSAHVNQALRKSRITIGLDENKRTERADNYALDVDFPATAGRPG